MAQAIEGGSAETKNPQPQSGGVFNQLVGTALGLVLQGSNDRRQQRMNEKLMQQQLLATKSLGRWEQEMALNLWDKTGYAAQRKQMEEAGLNPGLMYGNAGGGGTTQRAGSTTLQGGSPMMSGGEIGMGITTALHAAQLQAQVENIKASTENIKADTEKKAGVDTAQTAADVNLKIAHTENEKVNNAILQLQEQITQIERNVKAGTEKDTITAIQNAAQSTAQELRSDTVKANVDERTQAQIIRQINRASQEQAIRIEAQKLGLIKTGAEIEQIEKTVHQMNTSINNMIQENMRQWDKMSQTDRELKIKEIVAEATKQNSDFNTSTPQQVKQWTDLIMSVMTLGLTK